MRDPIATIAPVRALSWSIVGAGSIGCRHLRNLRTLGVERLSAVRRRVQPLTGDLADVAVVTTLPPADGDRAAALICSPTACHAADAVTAIEAGYHVLIEKPIAATAAGAAAIAAAAQRHGRLVMVASCLRFHPMLQRLRQIVSSGELGAPYWLSVWCGQHLADWRPERPLHEAYSARSADGGGVLLDLIHEIDYLQWIWGDARLISARLGTGRRLGIDAEDTADLLLSLPSGGVATCHLDYLARPASRGGRLHAETGSARWDLLVPTLELWTAREGAWRVVSPAPDWTVNHMYLDEVKAFADAVAGAENVSPASDGERALALALEARAAGAPA